MLINPLITTNLKVPLKAVKGTMSDRYRWHGFGPTFKGAHPRNRSPRKNRCRAPTAAYGTHARVIRIRRSRSRMRSAASHKIHMTTAASQLPWRETNAQRAAELIYRSVIKKYGNPRPSAVSPKPQKTKARD
jgi:hypothetical protein